MPVVELPSAPVTGYGDLGRILLQGASGYGQLKLHNDEEARRRAQQLQDVQSQRDYETQRAETQRKNLRADELNRTQQQIALALVNERLLDPSDLNDPQKVAAAFAKAKELGLYKEYQDLLNTPDLNAVPDAAGNLPPLLTIGDIGDPAKVNAARQKFSVLKAAQTKRTLDTQTNAQETADNLQKKYDQVMGEADKLQTELNQPIETVVRPPAPEDVQRMAVQLALDANGGKQPSGKDIAAQMPVAAQQLQQQRLEMAMIHRQQVQERVKLLHETGSSLGARLNSLSSKSIFPSSSTFNEPSTAPAVSAPAPTADPAARQKAMQSIVDSLKGGTAATAPATPAAAPLPHATAEPLIQQENQRRAGMAEGQAAQSWQKNLADPFHDTADKINKLTQWIAVLRNPIPKPGQVPIAPADRAQMLSQALTELDALQQQSDKQKRTMLGLDPSQVLANPAVGGPPPAAVSNANGSAPFAMQNFPWWRNMTDAPAASY